jgi:site-specific DNA-methyltransferase (adenine-specific)
VIQIELGNSINLYSKWPTPMAIISDGPYGLSSYPGDLKSPDRLADWYEPHIEQWSRFATPATTLWFWNSELGWASVHGALNRHGWEYRNCHIWDKGMAHVAGNSNGSTLRKFPVTTEVCVQYTKRPVFPSPSGPRSMKEWLRSEWLRSGLPLSKTNAACGVKNAATRKYFTQCHLWYYPPPEAFEMLASYANQHGRRAGRPYFSVDGKRPVTRAEWAAMRSKFNFKNGITNVWQVPAVRDGERVKGREGYVHMNQKPLILMVRCIEASTDPGDVVWEPFGGLCSATVAAGMTKRRGFAAEINPRFFAAAANRLAETDGKKTGNLFTECGARSEFGCRPNAERASTTRTNTDPLLLDAWRPT